MKTILVPIDGSQYSERAMKKAKELADCLGSKIILLNILSFRSTVSYYHHSARLAQDSSSLDWLDIVEKAKTDGEKLLKESKEILDDTEVETVVLDEPGAEIANTIIEYADKRNVDMIVMGSNGLGSRVRRIYLGSVTTKVLHTTNKPVLVIQ